METAKARYRATPLDQKIAVTSQCVANNFYGLNIYIYTSKFLSSCSLLLDDFKYVGFLMKIEKKFEIKNKGNGVISVRQRIPLGYVGLLKKYGTPLS